MSTCHFPRDARAQSGAWTDAHTTSGVDVTASELTAGAPGRARPLWMPFSTSRKVGSCSRSYLHKGDERSSQFWSPGFWLVMPASRGTRA
jgi:hypothetical protein